MAIGVNQADHQRNIKALPPLYGNGHTGETFGHHAEMLADEFFDTFLDPEDNTDFDPKTGLVYFDYPDQANPTEVVRRSEGLSHYLNLCLGVSGKNAALVSEIMFHLGSKIAAEIAELTDQTMIVAASSHDTFALEEQGA